MPKRHPVTHDNGKPDLRYSVALEFCGHEKPHYVARFCDDERIGSSQFYSSAVMLAIGHNAQRKGAMIIEELSA